MSLFDMFFRDTIKSPAQHVSTAGVVDEFDNLSARISSWALREHNEDGTHNVRPSGFDFVPIGAMTMWAGSSAPDGWLLCDGSQVSRTTYQTLFSIVGTTYGAGDGSTTFNLPDLRQKFPLGKAASGTGNTLGSTGGAIDHSHSISGSGSTSTDGGHSHTGSTGSVGAHSHTATTSSDGSHSHGGNTGTPSSGVAIAHTTTPIPADTNGDGSTTNVSGWLGGNVIDDGVQTHPISSDGGHTHSLTTSSEGAHSHSIGSDGDHSHSFSVSGTSGTNNPPYLVVNYIILSGV